MNIYLRSDVIDLVLKTILNLIDKFQAMQYKLFYYLKYTDYI